MLHLTLEPYTDQNSPTSVYALTLDPAARIPASQQQSLEAFRQKHGITMDAHQKMLARAGWTQSEYERGRM